MPELTRREAFDILLQALPDDCGVRELVCEYDEEHDVVMWTAEVFDAYGVPAEDLIGHASFMEHWPQVDVRWL